MAHDTSWPHVPQLDLMSFLFQMPPLTYLPQCVFQLKFTRVGWAKLSLSFSHSRWPVCGLVALGSGALLISLMQCV